MKVRSVNRATPTTFLHQGKEVQTGIVKMPIDGPATIQKLGLMGDHVMDTKYHGGEYKAIYAFGWENYPYFQEYFPELEMPPGVFGENLTISGNFSEKAIELGDRFKLGEAILEAAEPRCPCFKLGWRFGSQKVVKIMAQSGIYGVYFKVVQEGQFWQGDDFIPMEKSDSGLSVSQAGLWMCTKKGEPEAIRMALEWNGMSPHVAAVLKGMLPTD